MCARRSDDAELPRVPLMAFSVNGCFAPFGERIRVEASIFVPGRAGLARGIESALPGSDRPRGSPRGRTTETGRAHDLAGPSARVD